MEKLNKIYKENVVIERLIRYTNHSRQEDLFSDSENVMK